MPPAAVDTLRDVRQKLRHSPIPTRSLVEDLLSSEDMDNMEAEVLTDLYHPQRPGFFSAYLHGRKYPDLRFHVRPRGAMSALSGPEEVALINLNPGDPMDAVLYLAHLGSEYKAGTASSGEDKRLVAVQEYSIETEVAKNARLTGKTTVRFQAPVTANG